MLRTPVRRGTATAAAAAAILAIRRWRSSRAGDHVAYVSTRSTNGARYTFKEAVEAGYAKDGGLFVPETFPSRFTDRQLCGWADRLNAGRLRYEDVAFAVLRKFIGRKEVGDATLKKILAEAYGTFSNAKRCVEIQKVNGLHIAELWHGPTFCFKDLGMQIVVRLLMYLSAGAPRTLLVSTTGDTGPAVMRAVVDADKGAFGSSKQRRAKRSSKGGVHPTPAFRCVVCHPHDQISELQRRQMTCLNSPASRTIAFEGGGDDMDAVIKTLAGDAKFQKKHGLTGVNSYNIGRPAAQVTHYIWGYLHALAEARQGGGKKPTARDVDFAVPVGAMGNLIAGVYASKLGVPIRRIDCGCNVNDITYRAFANGDFHRAPKMKRNISEAINIQVPYNYERILYYGIEEATKAAAAGDAAKKQKTKAKALSTRARVLAIGKRVRKLMRTFDGTGNGFTVPPPVMRVFNHTRPTFARPLRCGDAVTYETMERYARAHRYYLCPHSAVGVRTAEVARDAGDATPHIVLATAHWGKFGTLAENAGKVAGRGKGKGRRTGKVPASPPLPAPLRKLLSQREQPFALDLRALRGRDLRASQKVWEREIRTLLNTW